jgi:hypothetical protein
MDKYLLTCGIYARIPNWQRLSGERNRTLFEVIKVDDLNYTLLYMDELGKRIPWQGPTADIADVIFDLWLPMRFLYG